MKKQEVKYECPHCGGVDTLLINEWKIALGRRRPDYGNGYICIKCKGKVEAVARGRRHLCIEPKARKVAA